MPALVVLVHFRGDLLNGRTEIMEVDVRVVGQERHGNGTVRELLSDHPCGEPHAERIVVHTGLPDTDFIASPGFDGADRSGDRGDIGNVTAAAGASVLQNGNWMECRYASGELAIFFRRRRRVFILTFPAYRVVECPVFGVALTSLHGCAMELVVGFGVGGQVAGREMDILFRHTQFGVDAIEAEFEICLGEGERMVHTDRLSLFDPFVHTPEMSVFEVEVHGVDHACDDGELFGGADGSADADRIIGCCLLPGFDVFECLGTVKFFDCLVVVDGESRAREFEERFFGKLGGIGQDFRVECGVVPPIGRDFAKRASHNKKPFVNSFVTTETGHVHRLSTRPDPVVMWPERFESRFSQ